MSLPLTLTREHFIGQCSRCGIAETTVHCLYIEAADYTGTTPVLCDICWAATKQEQLHLEEPPQECKRKPPSRQLRRKIRKEERETAAMIGGYAQKASGAMASAKSDVRLKGILRGEEKSTEKQSFILKRSVLDKIRGECVGAERPFVSIRFRNPITLATEDRWIVIPAEDWEHNKNVTA